MLKLLNVALVLAASMTGVLGMTQVKADTLSGAQWGFGSVVAVNPDSTDFFRATTFGVRSVSGPGGFAQVQSAATPVPAITSTATSTASGFSSAAQGNLFYSVEVAGPGGFVPINLNITAYGSLLSMAGPPFGSFSQARLYVNGETILDVNSDQGNNNGAFTVSMTIPVLANNRISVQMIAYALTQAASVSATTFLDPYFFLDPSLVSAGYSILTSAGIGNSLASAIPLPAAFPLLTTGLGMMSLLGWRRKRKNAAALAAACSKHLGV